MLQIFPSHVLVTISDYTIHVTSYFTANFINVSFLFVQAVRERHRERDRSREDRVSGGDRDQVIDDDEDLSPSSSVKRERQDSFEGRSHNGSPIGGANIRIANRGEI